VQVFDFQKCHCDSSLFILMKYLLFAGRLPAAAGPGQPFSFGSNASRSPSPNRFSDRTIREMTIAGMTRRKG